MINGQDLVTYVYYNNLLLLLAVSHFWLGRETVANDVSCMSVPLWDTLVFSTYNWQVKTESQYGRKSDAKWSSMLEHLTSS